MLGELRARVAVKKLRRGRALTTSPWHPTDAYVSRGAANRLKTPLSKASRQLSGRVPECELVFRLADAREKISDGATSTTRIERILPLATSGQEYIGRNILERASIALPGKTVEGLTSRGERKPVTTQTYAISSSA